MPEPMTFSGNENVWFYRQPGGCFEIGQCDDVEEDIIHIDVDDVPQFLAEMKAYIKETDPRLGTQP